jgi:hypothetical protein
LRNRIKSERAEALLRRLKASHRKRAKQLIGAPIAISTCRDSAEHRYAPQAAAMVHIVVQFYRAERCVFRMSLVFVLKRIILQGDWTIHPEIYTGK